MPNPKPSTKPGQVHAGQIAKIGFVLPKHPHFTVLYYLYRHTTMRAVVTQSILLARPICGTAGRRPGGGGTALIAIALHTRRAG
jgi:hypothetical protein